jgi:hypothetical protein
LKGYHVILKDIEIHAKDQGSWTNIIINSLGPVAKTKLYQDIATAGIELVIYLSGIRAERD